MRTDSALRRKLPRAATSATGRLMRRSKPDEHIVNNKCRASAAREATDTITTRSERSSISASGPSRRPASSAGAARGSDAPGRGRGCPSSRDRNTQKGTSPPPADGRSGARTEPAVSARWKRVGRTAKVSPAVHLSVIVPPPTPNRPGPMRVTSVWPEPLTQWKI